MKPEHISEVKGIIIFAIGIIFLASLISFVPEDLAWFSSNPNIPAKNFVRITGAYLAGSLLFVFGLSSYSLVLFLFFWGWNQFFLREIRFSIPKLLNCLVFLCVISSLFGLMGSHDSAERFQSAGFIGLIIADFLSQYLGFGAYVILFMLGALSLIGAGEFLLRPLFVRFFENLNSLGETLKERWDEKKILLPALKPKINIGQPTTFNQKKSQASENEDESKEEVAQASLPSSKLGKPKIRITESPQGDDKIANREEPKPVGEYFLPSLDLLNDPPKISTDKIQSTLMSGAKLLEKTLKDFGVSARVADIERGPAITRYELEPAPGVKVQKFTTLSDDIALVMKVAAVRIVAPIPGKNRVGIEVPNEASASVFLKEVLANNQFRFAESKLMLALGKDISGKPMIADLCEMPHLLIAGTTGSGKTVCVNGIIMSFLFNAAPDEIKFLMVDPKMVELAQYNDIPHLLCPTVTDSKRAAAALNWVVGEMETRYQKLSKAGVRTIKAYNQEGNKMPYLVVIIDELADLMQVSAKTVESSITRLAQLSRAVGIHLILATQRPSVDVITGVIKANFPARISFKVASKVDSRTVLDANGAENLLGKGDMLFIKPGDAKPTRGQCSFVKDDEIAKVIDFIKKQQAPVYDENIIQQQKKSSMPGGDQSDEYYDEAVQLVVETNQASVSILQRRLRLGYTRAARLIDMMEQNGVVGPYVGSKARDILVDREQWLVEHMKNQEEEIEEENEKT